MTEADIVVIGGGPAGAVAARELARFGYSVCLLERDGRVTKVVGESLAGSIVPLLESLELLETFMGAGFGHTRGTRLRWATDTIEEIPHQAGGLLVDRNRFDQTLRGATIKAGVRYISPATARIETEDKESIHVSWKSPHHGNGETIRSRFVIDATGRATAKTARRDRLFPKMLALCGHWTSARPPMESTVVESAPWGWAWGAPLPSDVFSAIAFIDPGDLKLNRSKGVTSFYQGLTQSLELFSFLDSASLAGEVTACDASIRLSRNLVAGRIIRIGEAACTLDPLSSQGIQAAIRSATQAAIVVNTILQQPNRTESAIRFYCDRQSETAQQNMSVSARKYQSCRRFSGHKFWEQRHSAAEKSVSGESTTPLFSWSEWDTLVRWSPEATLEPTPVIEGNLIGDRPALYHPNLDRPVAWLAKAPIFRYFTLMGPPVTAGDLLETWCEFLPEPLALEVFSWMMEHEILEPSNFVDASLISDAQLNR